MPFPSLVCYMLVSKVLLPSFFRKAVNAGGTSPTANIAFIFLWVHTISLETYGFVSRAIC